MSDTYIPARVRREVAERAHFCCEYCRTGMRERPIDFVIDHIIAEKHGGETETHNLCLSCYWCNSYKGSDISSVDWAYGEAIIGLFDPRKHGWDDHFRLNNARIQPLSATDRVTVFLLRLNADERVKERKLLLRLGIYPCA